MIMIGREYSTYKAQGSNVEGARANPMVEWGARCEAVKAFAPGLSNRTGIQIFVCHAPPSVLPFSLADQPLGLACF